MKLELECTWNDKKNKAKQRIHFDFRPKSIFNLPEEKIVLIQKTAHNAHLEGPPVLKVLEKLTRQFPKSLYARLHYFKILHFFEYFEEAEDLFTTMKRQFPEDVFTKCLIGQSLLSNKEYEKFQKLFNHIEVLKGVFPKRRDFYFEEALFFHNLWGQFFFETGNGLQAGKHKKIILLILNTLQNCQIISSPE
jgi:hypothetical protein